MIHICAATFRADKNKPMRPALAIVSAPGLSDVMAFIEVDNKGVATVYTGKVWDYQLSTNNPVTVQLGAASFDI